MYAYIQNPPMREGLGTRALGMVKWKRWWHHPLEDSAAGNRAMAVLIGSSTPPLLLCIRGIRSPGGQGQTKSSEVVSRVSEHMGIYPAACFEVPYQMQEQHAKKP